MDRVCVRVSCCPSLLDERNPAWTSKRFQNETTEVSEGTLDWIGVAGSDIIVRWTTLGGYEWGRLSPRLRCSTPDQVAPVLGSFSRCRWISCFVSGPPSGCRSWEWSGNYACGSGLSLHYFCLPLCRWGWNHLVWATWCWAAVWCCVFLLGSRLFH
jgi:hypothetical protein